MEVAIALVVGVIIGIGITVIALVVAWGDDDEKG